MTGEEPPDQQDGHPEDQRPPVVPRKLLPGTAAAARGNGGAPSNVLRERLRGSFRERVPIVEQIADRIGWKRLRHRCEHCGREPSDAADTEEIILEAPTITETLRALELMARYGLGTIRGMSEDDVRTRLASTIDAIEQELEAAVAQRVLRRIAESWR